MLQGRFGCSTANDDDSRDTNDNDSNECDDDNEYTTMS